MVDNLDRWGLIRKLGKANFPGNQHFTIYLKRRHFVAGKDTRKALLMEVMRKDLQCEPGWS
jgi:hypothetical protein